MRSLTDIVPVGCTRHVPDVGVRHVVGAANLARGNVRKQNARIVWFRLGVAIFTWLLRHIIGCGENGFFKIWPCQGDFAA